MNEGRSHELSDRLNIGGPVDTYKVHTVCSNCGIRTYSVNIPKGQPVSTQECSNCGCRMLTGQPYQPFRDSAGQR